MGYSPHNPYIPGDPYSYDLKWIVRQIRKLKGLEGSDSDIIKELLEEIVEEQEEKESILTYFSHTGEDKYNTSWILLKIPKAEYTLEFHHASGSAASDPNVPDGDPISLMKKNITRYEIVNNFNLFNEDYSWRFNGSEYIGTNNNYRLFGFNTSDQDWTISESGALISAVPEQFDTVLKVGGIVVSNGSVYPSADNTLPNVRAAFGSDTEYWYLLYCEGRSNYERGLTLYEMGEILRDHGCMNAFNIDGGASVCLAVNDRYNAVKINEFRDQTLPYPQLRPTAMCACFIRR